MYYLGIDWANDKHDLCLLDETGSILKQMTIAQDLTGFQQLEWLVNRYGVDKIHFNIERSSPETQDCFTALSTAVVLEMKRGLFISPSLSLAVVVTS